MRSEIVIIWNQLVINVKYKGKALTYMFDKGDVDLDVIKAKERELKQKLKELVIA